MRRAVPLLCLVSAIALAGVPDEIAKIRKTLKTHPASAHAMVSTLLAWNGSSAAVHAAAGDVAFRLGDFEEADKQYRTALKADPHSGRALRGEGHLAEICSYRKTAKDYFESAYEADPDDPEILRDWAGLQAGDTELAALERYLRIARDADDDELEDVRAHIAMHKGTLGRDLNRLTSPYQSASIPLESIFNDRQNLRGYSIAIKINGSKTFHLLLDTGASGVILNSKAGRKARLEPLSTSPLRGAGDDTRHSAYVSIAGRLTIGDVALSDYLVRVADDSPVKDVDGIIGADVFQQFAIRLDFPHRVLLLEPFATADGKPVDVEDDSYNRVRRPGYLDAFRLGAHLVIPGSANDSGTVLFLLDTGAYDTLISRDFAAQVSRVRSDYSLRLSGVAGKVNAVYQADNLKLRFAGVEQMNKRVLSFDFTNLCRQEGVEIAGLLGFPTLARFVLELDYRNGLVRLTAQ